MVLLYGDAKSRILASESVTEANLERLKRHFGLLARPSERIRTIADLMREREDNLATESDADLDDESGHGLEMLRAVQVIVDELNLEYPEVAAAFERRAIVQVEQAPATPRGIEPATWLPEGLVERLVDGFRRLSPGQLRDFLLELRLNEDDVDALMDDYSGRDLEGRLTTALQTFVRGIEDDDFDLIDHIVGILTDSEIFPNPLNKTARQLRELNSD